MSARFSSRRLGPAAIARICRPSLTPCRPSSAAFSTAPRPQSSENKDLSNPVLEDYLEKQELQKKKQQSSEKQPKLPAIREGQLPMHSSSLFRPEREIPGWRPRMRSAKKKAVLGQMRAEKSARTAETERALTAMTLDPDPHKRRTLERRLVIAGVKRHGRLTKAQTLARTERQSLYKSQALPTSVKKLQKVVNQLAGKTVSEALVQLRFSPKKVARDVIKGLEIAQNEAIVARGMGLSGGRLALQRWQQQRANADAGTPRDIWDHKFTLGSGRVPKEIRQKHKPTLIELKDGTKKLVNPSDIYIDQAWVGPGAYWKSPEFRARGAVNMLRHRTTSFTLLLKEEKTRMRISDEIKKKRDNRRLWTALPDRPVTSQRQYCLW